MREFYKETVSTCHQCGNDIKGVYWQSDEGMLLETNCPQHGLQSELVEKDVNFFRSAYEYEGYVHLKYLILPVTYQCNLKCKYCYSHSNYNHLLPADRSIDRLVEILKDADCPTVNLAGGEPTVRKDLPALLSAVKRQTSVKRLCVVTNGQKTINEHYLKNLHDSGMDFLFLPLHIAGYSTTGKVMDNIIKSLENAYKLAIPVWVQATIENIHQIAPVLKVVEKYHKTIFNVTIRSVRPYGITNPKEMVHVSDIVKYLGFKDNYEYGNHPFNRHVKLFGRTTKVSSWVNDRIKLDAFDATYVIQDDAIMPFHKGMILDDIFFKGTKSHC